MKFTEILDQLGVEYRVEGQHTRPGWVQLRCPFCQGDWYLGYNLASNYINCWRCSSLWVVNVLEQLGMSRSEALTTLPQIDRDNAFLPQARRGKLVYPSGVGELLPAHQRYLKKRGFDVDRLQRLWGVKGIGLSAKLPWRIFLPITLEEEVVSWTTRSIDKDVPTRYVSASIEQESVHHKDLLYGEQYARHSIIICEGPFDVWAIGPGAVATFGTGYSQAQLLRMLDYPVRVVCYDNEREAQKRADRLVSELGAFPGITYNARLDGKDPASSPKKNIRELRRRFLR